MKKYLLVALLFVSGICLAQKKVAYTPSFQFKKGVFLDRSAFVNNSAIPFNQLLVNRRKKWQEVDPSQLCLKCEHKVKGGASFDLRSVWGYTNGRSVFILENDGFVRLANLGTLAFYIHAEQRTTSTGPDPRSPMAVSETVMEKKVFDTRTNMIHYLRPKVLKELIKSDEELLKEYEALNKRKQKKQEFIFLKKFNERNPLYIRS